ncbi:hypothetical protein ISCGN_002180 [Ixodes scapularis]
MLLQLYKGLILARPLYALPLIRLSGNQIENLERAQRVALRICIGVPRSASSRHTLTEAATAAAFFEAAAVGIHERLSHQASSTTAELAAIRLALWGIRTGCARGLSWVVLSDSRSALGLLSELERATPLARSVAQDAAELREKGHEIIFQWIPSHCGIRGNEVADSLAAQAHKDPGCPLSTVPRFSDAKLLVRRTITRQNPDPRVADGTFSARLPRGLDRHTAAVLHRLRTGSAFTPAWIGRFRPDLNPNCQTCQETADAEHLLLHCTDYNDERTALHNAYSRLGLSSDSLEDLLHPRATRAVTDMALKKLITYMKDTELLEIL